TSPCTSPRNPPLFCPLFVPLRTFLGLEWAVGCLAECRSPRLFRRLNFPAIAQAAQFLPLSLVAPFAPAYSGLTPVAHFYEFLVEENQCCRHGPHLDLFQR